MSFKPAENFLEQVRQTKERAQQIIKVDLPRKICDLNEYLETFQNEFLNSQDVSRCDVNGKKVECNKEIMELNAKLKEEMVYYLEIYDVLEMWITYNRAPYDNGNPIGEEIQNELYTYLENGKDSALEMFNALKDYHHVRANSINSARGNLNVVDLAESIHALDISHYITLCQGFRDLRNAYSMILDKIDKNYDKLVNPKGIASHIQHEFMY